MIILIFIESEAFSPSGILTFLFVFITSPFITLNTRVSITLQQYLKESILDFISPSYKMTNMPMKSKWFYSKHSCLIVKAARGELKPEKQGGRPVVCLRLLPWVRGRSPSGYRFVGGKNILMNRLYDVLELWRNSRLNDLLNKKAIYIFLSVSSPNLSVLPTSLSLRQFL